MSGEGHEIESEIGTIIDQVNDTMPEEINEEDKNNDQGSLIINSDSGFDDNINAEMNMNILQFGHLSINLEQSAFERFSKEDQHVPISRESSS